MKSRRHGGNNRQDVYSQDYHLSRAVQCVDCGTPLHKTHHYVWYGNRCRPCYQAAQEAVVSDQTRS